MRERSKKFNKLEAVILMKMTMKPNMFNVLEVDEPNRSLGSQATETGMMSIKSFGDKQKNGDNEYYHDNCGDLEYQGGYDHP